MAHSFVSSTFHIVFSTKNRMQLIPEDVQQILWNYVAGIARNHGIGALAVAGTRNHIHILIALPAGVALSCAVRDLKANSSGWMCETDRLFSWQEGYGGFSVSPSQLDRVKSYIAGQKAHHVSRSFEDEFAGMLKTANFQFNPGDAPG